MFLVLEAFSALVLIELALWFIAVTLFVAFDKGWGAFWATAAIVGLMWWHKVPVWATLTASPSTTLMFAILYVAVGLLWATFKFTRKLVKARDLYTTERDKWKERARAKSPDLTEAELQSLWQKEVTNSYSNSRLYAPTVSDNKENIAFWAWWWPFSMVAFVFGDFLTWLKDSVYNAVKGAFERLRRQVLGEAAEIFKKD